VAIGN